MSRTSLEALMAPASIAVFGASDDPSRIGGRPLQQLREHGFTGRVYGVNPRYTEVQGFPCFPDLASLPEVPDVAVLSINAEAGLAAIEACAANAVPAAVMFSAGFAELNTQEGLARQARLVDAGRRGGMAVAGPNCTGIVNLRSGAVMSFSAFTPATGPGRVALLSQSGALASSIFAAGEEAALDFGHIITTGNEALLSLTDYLDYFAADPACDTVIAYIEQVRDGARFLRAASSFRRQGKLLVVMKVGRSAKGMEAAQSHTAALAGNDRAYRVAFRDAGIAEANDIGELVDIAALYRFSAGKRLRGGTGVLSVSGAAGVALADMLADAGQAMPTLDAGTQARLRALVPDYGMVSNPVDVTANVVNDASTLPTLLSILGEAPGIGAIVLYMSGGLLGRSLPTLVLPPDQLVLNVDGLRNGDRAAIRAAGVAHFLDMDRAVRALAAVMRWYAHSSPEAAPANADDMPEVQAILDAAWAAGRTSLTEVEGKRLLAAAGLEGVADHVVNDAAEAGIASEAVGFPVVLKLVSPDVLHKSEIGGVKLGIASVQGAAAAFNAIMASASQLAPQARIDGVAVQPQVDDGVELLLGATRDPAFGWLVTVGLGGVWTELMGDVSQALPPVSEDRAMQMLRSLRGFSLLDGYRGAPIADLPAACRAIARFSALLMASGDALAELEVNPLLIRPQGKGAVAADALVVLAPRGTT